MNNKKSWLLLSLYAGLVAEGDKKDSDSNDGNKKGGEASDTDNFSVLPAGLMYGGRAFVFLSYAMESFSAGVIVGIAYDAWNNANGTLGAGIKSVFGGETISAIRAEVFGLFGGKGEDAEILKSSYFHGVGGMLAADLAMAPIYVGVMVQYGSGSAIAKKAMSISLTVGGTFAVHEYVEIGAGGHVGYRFGSNIELADDVEEKYKSTFKSMTENKYNGVLGVFADEENAKLVELLVKHIKLLLSDDDFKKLDDAIKKAKEIPENLKPAHELYNKVKDKDKNAATHIKEFAEKQVAEKDEFKQCENIVEFLKKFISQDDLSKSAGNDKILALDENLNTLKAASEALVKAGKEGDEEAKKRDINAKTEAKEQAKKDFYNFVYGEEVNSKSLFADGKQKPFFEKLGIDMSELKNMMEALLKGSAPKQDEKKDEGKGK